MLFLIAFLWAGTGFGQSKDTLNFNHNSGRLGINTFFTRNDIQGIARWRKYSFKTDLANNHVYNQIQTKGNRFVSRDLKLFTQLEKAFENGWTLGQENDILDFAANQTRIIASYVGLGKTFMQTQKHTLIAKGNLGWMMDKRIVFTNQGPSITGKVQYSTNLDNQSMHIYAMCDIQNHYILPRKNNAVRFTTGLYKDFEGQASIGLEAGKKIRRVEDFFQTDIQSIISDTSYLRLNLNYNLSKNLFYKSDNLIQIPNRAFNYRNKESGAGIRNVYYEQGEFESNQELNYRGKKIQGFIKLDFKQRNREYGIRKNFSESDSNFTVKLARYNETLETEKIKDIKEQNLTWNFGLVYKLNAKQTLRYNYSAQLLRVDTRSLLNTQDRDEILYANELTLNTKVMQNFSTDIKLSGSLRQFVFLDAKQSIENFKERILRLEPGFQWGNSRFSWKGLGGIWVTYQVRDFESAQDKNRSNRILIFNHNLNYKLYKRNRLNFDLLRRENRLGLLNWKNFSESPIDTVVIWDLSLRFQKSFEVKKINSLNAEIGFRYYRQTRKNKAGLSDGGTLKLTRIENVILQYGPQLILQYYTQTRFRFESEFWFQQSHIFNRFQTYERPFYGITTNLNDLNQIQKKFLPYFTITAGYILGK